MLAAGVSPVLQWCIRHNSTSKQTTETVAAQSPTSCCSFTCMMVWGCTDWQLMKHWLHPTILVWWQACCFNDPLYWKHPTSCTTSMLTHLPLSTLNAVRREVLPSSYQYPDTSYRLLHLRLLHTGCITNKQLLCWTAKCWMSNVRTRHTRHTGRNTKLWPKRIYKNVVKVLVTPPPKSRDSWNCTTASSRHILGWKFENSLLNLYKKNIGSMGL